MIKRVTKEMVRAGAQAQFEQMNGKRPTNPDNFDSPEDFVERLRWYDYLYKEAFPRYVRNFKIGLEAAIRRESGER